MYHFGVAQAIRDCGLCERYELTLCGSSAGATAATALACGADFHAMRDFALDCGDDCRRHWWNVFRMKEYLLASIQRFGAAPFAPARLAATQAQLRRVEVYATLLPSLRPKVFTALASFEEAEQAVVASCCFTPVVGLPFQLRETGEWVADGGLATFQPRAGEPGVVTVSPFYFGDAHVKPSTVVPVWWGLRPPPRALHRQLFDLGYNDAIEFFTRAGYAPPQALERRRPAVRRLRRGPLAFAKDALFALLYLLVLRPVAVVLVYGELLTIAVVCFIHALWSHHPRDWAALYQDARGLVSARQFVGLLVSAAVPFNAARLSARSRLYRNLRPLFFFVSGGASSGKGGGKSHTTRGAGTNKSGSRHQGGGFLGDAESSSDDDGSGRRRHADGEGASARPTGARRWIVDTFFSRHPPLPRGAYMHHGTALKGDEARR